MPPSFTKPTDTQLENRFLHHPPHGDQAERYAKIRATMLDAAKVVRDLTPCSPEQTMAINGLDSAMFHANAAIARHEPAPAAAAPSSLGAVVTDATGEGKLKDLGLA